VSLNTFLFSTFGALFGLVNNYNWKIILFLYVYSSMQFIEYNIWNTISDKSANEFWSKIAFASIGLQPYFAINIIENNVLRNTMFAIYTLFALILLYIQPVINFITTIGPNKHLTWNWLDYPLIIGILWSLFVVVPFLIEKEYIMFVGGVLTFSLTYYLYAKDKTFGSIWCWVVNSAWILVILRSFGMFRCLN